MRFLSSAIPVLGIICCCSFCVNWSQIEFIKAGIFHQIEKEFVAYQAKYVCETDGKYYINFQMPEGVQGFEEGEVLPVRFSENKFTHVSSTRSHERCVWTLGFVEYQQKGQWKPMFMTMDKEAHFQIPITIRHGKIYENDKTRLMNGYKFFNQMLHMKLAQNQKRERAKAIQNRNCSPKKIMTHVQK